MSDTLRIALEYIQEICLSNDDCFFCPLRVADAKITDNACELMNNPPCDWKFPESLSRVFE